VHGHAMGEPWAHAVITRWPAARHLGQQSLVGHANLDIFARALGTHGVFDYSITAIARSTGNTTVEEPA
jgi:hypothetical protein